MKVKYAFLTPNAPVQVFDNIADLNEVRETQNGCVEYKRTFASIKEAVVFFGVPADWAMGNGKKKWGRGGGNFYGYEIAENGEAIVWSDF